MDAENAFNQVSRRTALARIKEHFPLHALGQGLGFLPIIFETTGQMHHETLTFLRQLPGTSLPCPPDPVHCPVEVLDVHPAVHPATFDGARDHRTQLRDLRAKIQGDLRDLPRGCAGLWLHGYHVIVYVHCVYCVIVIVIECN